MKGFKRPESVLVVVYTATGKVLLMRRKDKPGFWQSVTGSMRWDEHSPEITAQRELKEETGLSGANGLHDWGKTYRFNIPPHWAQRYAPGTRENVEHFFSLELPDEAAITLNPDEHVEFAWFPFDEALVRVTSWTNREAIQLVQEAKAR